MWANFQRIVEVFTQKIVTKLSKIWVWDPGYGKNLFRIPDPGVKNAPDPGSGSATLPTSVSFFLSYKNSFIPNIPSVRKRPVLRSLGWKELIPFEQHQSAQWPTDLKSFSILGNFLLRTGHNIQCHIFFPCRLLNIYRHDFQILCLLADN